MLEMHKVKIFSQILKEKLTDNPLLYRFSEIVLLASMFVSILFIFSNKKA